jgi:hypothetical protein
VHTGSLIRLTKQKEYMKRVMIKIGKMRKADDCVVYPENFKNETIFVQGDRLVMLINPLTREALINHNTGSTYPTSWHLSGNHPNTYRVTVDQILLDQILACRPKRGDKIHGVVEIA